MTETDSDTAAERQRLESLDKEIQEQTDRLSGLINTADSIRSRLLPPGWRRNAGRGAYMEYEGFTLTIAKSQGGYSLKIPASNLVDACRTVDLMMK